LPNILGYYYPGTIVRLTCGFIGRFVKALPELGDHWTELKQLCPFGEVQSQFAIAHCPIMIPNVADVVELVPSGTTTPYNVGLVEEVVFLFLLSTLMNIFPHVHILGMENVFIYWFLPTGGHI
jgi:hypothetical protein